VVGGQVGTGDFFDRERLVGGVEDGGFHLSGFPGGEGLNTDRRR
jgi:hypothetical protein